MHTYLLVLSHIVADWGIDVVRFATRIEDGGDDGGTPCVGGLVFHHGSWKHPTCFFLLQMMIDIHNMCSIRYLTCFILIQVITYIHNLVLFVHPTCFFLRQVMMHVHNMSSVGYVTCFIFVQVLFISIIWFFICSSYMFFFHPSNNFYS